MEKIKMRFIAFTLALLSISTVAANAAEPKKPDAAEVVPAAGTKSADEAKE